MAFSAAQARLQDAVFVRLGADADWTGITDPVRVIHRSNEQIVGLTADDENRFRVRSSEVPAPVAGDIFTINGQDYQVIGKPLLDRNGTWRGEAKPV